MSDQLIIVNVQNSNGAHLFHFAVVYGLHTIQDRKSLWLELSDFVTNIQTPCIMMGDYNDVRYAADRIQGSDVGQAETIDFSNFMEDHQFIEAPSSVSPCWSVRSHSLLFTLDRIQQEGGRPFRSLIFLQTKKVLLKLRIDLGGSIHCNHKMKNIWEKLKVVKHALKDFHAKSFSKAHCKVEELRKKLAALRALPALQSDVTLQHEEKETLEKLKKWSHIDESILMQKSRINWLSMGDSNSKFFFTATRVRNARNKISLLHNSQEVVLTDP
ncbi:uncharacterized protein LOC104901029 [Beta vulgaris subsp. vulgaris]|uniref:uncharacterized protein LOC104901029 n=1 Tax=Beta vulgaris subsp. vulgaris TaxID=3555 RepID=UPI00053FB17C|nr:uncharacterized protein LOC104901029 [Beta vulgaris subsp. vulgaris]